LESYTPKALDLAKMQLKERFDHYFHEDQEPNDKQRADLIGEVLRIERELPTFYSE